MDILWVKLDKPLSWHIVNKAKTLCGLRYGVAAVTREKLGTEKSCENCLRIQARKEDS